MLGAVIGTFASDISKLCASSPNMFWLIQQRWAKWHRVDLAWSKEQSRCIAYYNHWQWAEPSFFQRSLHCCELFHINIVISSPGVEAWYLIVKLYLRSFFHNPWNVDNLFKFTYAVQSGLSQKKPSASQLADVEGGEQVHTSSALIFSVENSSISSPFCLLQTHSLAHLLLC